MARPIKDGVDYFPFDVSLDEKFELIEAEFGLTGFAVIVKLYQRIYSRGYYCEWTKEVALLFGRSVGLRNNVVSEIVSACIRRGIFDIEMYDKYEILTSVGIQKRYFEAVSRRKNVNLEKRYLLVDYAEFFKNVDIKWVNDNINSKNDNTNTQIRVKERKVKETKLERDTAPAKKPYGQFKNVYLEDEEYAELVKRFPMADEIIEQFSLKLKAKNYKYDSHYAAILCWQLEDESKTDANKSSIGCSYDLDDFFNAALKRSYGE